MHGVTISAGYGAGGSIIAPQVARLLGLPLLDRAISSHVASQLQVSVQEAEGGVIRRSLPDRFLAVLAPVPLAGCWPGPTCACAVPKGCGSPGSKIELRSAQQPSARCPAKTARPPPRSCTAAAASTG